MQQFIINGKDITGISTFYSEVNRVFMANENWYIAESLDAFNDLLYGGFGSIQTGATAQLIWKDISVSKAALGYDATMRYYDEKLQPGSPFNKKHFEEKRAGLQLGSGQTYFEIIVEIIGQHPNIELVTG